MLKAKLNFLSKFALSIIVYYFATKALRGQNCCVKREYTGWGTGTGKSFGSGLHHLHSRFPVSHTCMFFRYKNPKK